MRSLLSLLQTEKPQLVQFSLSSQEMCTIPQIIFVALTWTFSSGSISSTGGLKTEEKILSSVNGPAYFDKK